MKKIFLSVLILFLLGNVMAQKEANVWIFGQGIQLDFSTGKPVVSKGGFLVGSNGIPRLEGEASASFSDAQGNLLFFTEGEKVFNADGTVMINGTGLNGSISSTQGATILPKVGTTDEYYIFTTDGSKKGIQYSVVKYDYVKKQGEVIFKNVPLTTNQYMMQALTIVPHSNGTDSWVITHGAGGSDKYYTYQVSATGISEAIISSIGLNVPLILTSTGVFDEHEIGLIKSNSCYTQIAITNLRLKKLEILAFDNSTGKVGDVDVTIDGSFFYGIEFSPNGKYIYTSIYDTKKLVQFDLSSENVISSKVDLGTSIDDNIGQLQQGPDGKIYMAGNSLGQKTHLGVINSPNEKGVNSNVNLNLLEFDYVLNKQYCRNGLPQFAKQYISKPNCSPITSSLSSQKKETSIYPNPFTHTITINNISSSIDKIQLVDVYGNVVQEISNLSENLEMGNTISSGTYFIYLHSAENVEIQKVVKIK